MAQSIEYVLIGMTQSNEYVLSGMTQSNDYVFIIVPTNYFPLYTWEGADDELFYDESQKGKDRDEDAHKAFQVICITTL